MSDDNQETTTRQRRTSSGRKQSGGGSSSGRRIVGFLTRTLAALISILVALTLLKSFRGLNIDFDAIITSIEQAAQQGETSHSSSNPDDLVMRHMVLYEEQYHRLRQPNGHLMTHSNVSRQHDAQQRPEGALGATYGEDVTWCPVTVMFMDPRISHPTDYGQGQSAWYSLESVAAYLPTACVLLLTSSCTMEKHMRESHVTEAVDDAIRDGVYAKSLPLFRNMIDQGRVRLSYVDHQKYNLQACSNYGNPTAAFVNRQFWIDEFLEVDSDSVLVTQEDAVVCHSDTLFGSSLLPRFQKYAYVGGVWPRTISFIPDLCVEIPYMWRKWLYEEKKIRTQGRPNVPWNLRNVSTTISVCGDGKGALGNGGFSLRSRSWMVRAIEACPYGKWHGIRDESALPLPTVCRASARNEDVYFATVMSGLGAPFPDAAEASLFAMEMVFPEDVVDIHGLPPGTEVFPDKTSPRKSLTNVVGKNYTVPFGMHKPYWYHSNDLLLSDAMSDNCPFVRFIFTPKMSRWSEHYRSGRKPFRRKKGFYEEFDLS